MKKNSAYSNEYFSLDDIVNLLQQELDDARKEHDRLSGLLERHVGDDDTYILEDYVDDLQEYIDELEDLSDTFDRLTDVRSRLDGDIELLRSNFKHLGLS